MNEPLARANKRKTSKAVCRLSEEGLEHQCENYLYLLRITFLRIPTALLAEIAWKGSPQSRASVSKYLRGFPDLCLFFADGSYLLIELKSEKGKLSQGQRNWWKDLGLEPLVVRSFEEFKTIVGAEHKLHG